MADRNPCTIEEARAFVTHVESLFMPWDIPELLAGFTDDCIVRFGDRRSSVARRRSKSCSAAAASGKRIIVCARSSAP